MLHAIVGSAYMITVGGIIGVFWGMGAGIYLSEYGRGRFASLLRFTTDLLSGTPSIVVGLFVYALLVVPFKGFSALAGFSSTSADISSVSSDASVTEAFAARISSALKARIRKAGT